MELSLHDPIESDFSPDVPDEWWQQFPDEPAVFQLDAAQGEPYIARTNLLRRRLRRLLARPERATRLLHLGTLTQRIRYWPTPSQLGGMLAYWELTRRRFPEDYRKRLKLRAPYFLKVIRTNAFPRCQVTGRLAASDALWFGPFRTRAEADQFSGEVMDLFLVRRCEEDLLPNPDHPGCIYGEMQKCLRPCQTAVDAAGYRDEVGRLESFLATRGESTLIQVASEREQASEELDFERAARLHKRWEKLQEVSRVAGELPRELQQLNGIAITPTSDPLRIDLWPVHAGQWQRAVSLQLSPALSLDQQLRERWTGWQAQRISRTVDREDHLALLTRWYHSSWREGEWLAVEDFSNLPYRRLVRAISKASRTASA